MEVLEAAGQPGSFSGVVLVHMEVVEATGQPGSYPDVVKVHMEEANKLQFRKERDNKGGHEKEHGNFCLKHSH